MHRNNFVGFLGFCNRIGELGFGRDPDDNMCAVFDAVADEMNWTGDVASLLREFLAGGESDSGKVINAEDCWWESNNLFEDLI